MAAHHDEYNCDHMIPAGYRFCPLEEELLLYYLRPKVNGEQVPGKDRIVFDIDLYGDEPWNIWEDFKVRRENNQSSDLYFFTELKTVASNGPRIRRTIATDRKSTWKGEDRGKEIKADGTERVIGSRKRFRYEKKGSEGQHGHWIMHEFDLDPSLIHNQQEKKLVLCLLRKKEKSGGKRKEQKEEEKIKDDDLDNMSDKFLRTQEKRQSFPECNNHNDVLPPPILQQSGVGEFVAELQQGPEQCFGGEQPDEDWLDQYLVPAPNGFYDAVPNSSLPPFPPVFDHYNCR